MLDCFLDLFIVTSGAVTTEFAMNTEFGKLLQVLQY